jgi:hypothetical protein
MLWWLQGRGTVGERHMPLLVASHHALEHATHHFANAINHVCVEMQQRQQ